MKIDELRPLVFVVSFSLFYLSQKIIPRLKTSDHMRMYHNWYLLILSILSLKIFFPLGLSSVIDHFQKLGYYLIDLSSFSFVLDLIITVLIFDLAIYFQHRLFHISSFLWRFHKVHHSDQEMDTTTGIRFHPIEIVMSGFYKVVLIFLLSPRVETYLVYEMLLNSMALFNHSNLKINTKLDQMLKYIIVTPSMHVPHHNPEGRLMNMNYGNFLSIWDKIFKTYTDEIDLQDFGIKEYPKKLSIRDVFYMPFR